MASWDLSVIYTLIYPSWPLGRTLCPGMSQGLGDVVSILIWLLGMGSTTVNILCPHFPREKEGSDPEFLSVPAQVFLP